MTAHKPFSTDPEQVAMGAQSTVDAAVEMLAARTNGLTLAPDAIGWCMKQRIWECDRRSASGRPIERVDFHAFVHEPYPVGLGSSYDAIEVVIAGHPALVRQWEELTGRVVADPVETPVGAPTLVPIAKIRTDGGTQSRVSIDENVVADYAENLRALPPILVFYDGQSHWLVDGFHRLAAHVRAGRSGNIYTLIRRGSLRDAILHAAGANTKHGLRRTNADKRRSIEMLLSDEEWSAKADRWIADKCGVRHETVARVRATLRHEAAPENQQPSPQCDDSQQVAKFATCDIAPQPSAAPENYGTRLGQDGKQYPVKRNKSPQREPEPAPEPERRHVEYEPPEDEHPEQPVERERERVTPPTDLLIYRAVRLVERLVERMSGEQRREFITHLQPLLSAPSSGTDDANAMTVGSSNSKTGSVAKSANRLGKRSK